MSVPSYSLRELNAYELKPLFAFGLAILHDALLLENNRPGAKTIQWFGGVRADRFTLKMPSAFPLIGGKIYSIGVKNVTYALAIALGITVGNNVGMYADYGTHSIINARGNKESEKKYREHLTYLYEVSFSVLFVTLLHYYYKSGSDYTPTTGSRQRSSVISPNDIRMIRGIRSISKPGVNDEGVVDNLMKAVLSAISLSSTADKISDYFLHH